MKGLLDEDAGDRVDGDVPLLVRLGAFAELLAGLDDIVERDMDHAVAKVDVGDLDGAQLAPSYAGDRDKP